jgi:ABC-type Fe3+-hydroxamate transport system substrate-binding protein
MPNYIDQTGREVEVVAFPKRIVSLVPSQTELLASLGLEAEVVGITKFCIHPEEWFRSKTRIGGTKNLRIDLIRQLKPDLILANKEENKLEQIEMLEDYPVWASDVNDLASALQMIEEVGKMTGKAAEANYLHSQIQSAFQTLGRPTTTKSVLYFIWYQPWMAASSNTFINDMLSRLGFENLASQFGDRYPVIPTVKLKDLAPDYILLSSEPFPFSQKHVDELQERFPQATILLVDGSLFSWYGSRLLNSPTYFKQQFGNQFI